jgi:type II secretory pathway component PulC
VTPKIESEAENKTTSVSPDEKKTSPNLISEEAKVAPTNAIKPPEQTPDQSTTSPVSLRISGIIWSEDPSKRIAVINGSNITEGSIIEGVKVVQIHPTRVHFSHNNQFFEIPLGGSFTNRTLD